MLAEQRAPQLCAASRCPSAAHIGRDWLVPAAAVEAFRPNPVGVRLGRKPGKTGDPPG